MNMGSFLQAERARRGWRSGFAQAVPIWLGYISVGFAYGVLAQKAGISTLNTILMSVIVYAGSAQLIAVGLFASGVSAISVILTTFVVNLRHCLMSAAVSPYLTGWNKLEMAAFAYELTDETFVLHSSRFVSDDPVKAETFAINVSSQCSWVLGTWLGVVVGQSINDVRLFALDYALPAMFIALLVLQIKGRLQVLVAILSGLLAIVFQLVGFGQWTVIAATVAGATLGTVMEQWIKE
jgi:4-azaleucine resistance transporter AzlC